MMFWKSKNLPAPFRSHNFTSKICLRETNAHLKIYTFRVVQSDLWKIVHFSPTINIVYMTMHYPKIIFFQMNWSTRKKSLKPSLTNLTKPSLKCRVTKPCAVKKTLMQLSSFPHQLGRPQRCLGAWKIYSQHLQISLQCANLPTEKYNWTFFIHSFPNFIFKPIERDFVLVLKLASCTKHCT